MTAVLVWTMGRVGSKAVRKFVQTLEIECRIVHSLYSDGEFEGVNRGLRERADNGYFTHIVSIARDPVARGLSAFVYELSRTHAPVSPDLATMFMREYDFDWTQHWFDREFDQRFPGLRQSTPFHGDFTLYRPNVLVAKNEMLNALPRLVWEKFLGFDYIGSRIEYAHENMGLITHAHRDLLRGGCFDDDFLDEIYSSSYTKYFYTEAQIEGFKAKWRKP